MGSEQGADYFMDENIILVTLHYRINILGRRITLKVLSFFYLKTLATTFALIALNSNFYRFSKHRRYYNTR